MIILIRLQISRIVSQINMEIQGDQKAETSLPFTDYLASEHFNLRSLMLRPQIQSQLRTNRQKFISCLRTDTSLGHQLINKALLTSQFETQLEKQISAKCNAFITQSCSEIANLFIVAYPQKQGQNGEMQQSSELEGQKKEGKKFSEKYVYLHYLFKSLQQPVSEINNTSVGEIMKVLKNIIENNSNGFYQFINFHPQYLDRLLQIIKNFYGISEMLGKLVTEQISGYFELKEYILTSLINELKNDDVMESDCFENFFDFIDIVLTRSKFNSESPDRRNLAQKLVNDNIISYFISQVQQMAKANEYDAKNEIRLKNCLEYLIFVGKRLSEDDQTHSRFPNVKVQLPKATLDFQISPILQKYECLVMLPLCSKYSNLTRLAYYEFLARIKMNRYFQKIKFKTSTPAIELIKNLKAESSCGIIKIYMVDLIEFSINMLESINGTEALKIVSAIGPTESFLKSDRETLCFITKIIIIMTNKSSIFINQYKNMGIQQTINNYVNIVDDHIISNKKVCPEMKFLEEHREKAKKIVPKPQEDSSSSDDLQFNPKTPFSSNFQVRWEEDKNFQDKGFGEKSGFASNDNAFLQPEQDQNQ